MLKISKELKNIKSLSSIVKMVFSHNFFSKKNISIKWTLSQEHITFVLSPSTQTQLIHNFEPKSRWFTLYEFKMSLLCAFEIKSIAMLCVWFMLRLLMNRWSLQKTWSASVSLVWFYKSLPSVFSGPICNDVIFEYFDLQSEI